MLWWARVVAVVVAVGVPVAGCGTPSSDEPDGLAAAWDETDRTHNARMTQVLAEHGWPGWQLVGSDGAFAAWVLVQHADLDLSSRNGAWS